MLRIVQYLVLLAGLVSLVVSWPILWEIGLLGAIGGAWWVFFRVPPGAGPAE